MQSNKKEHNKQAYEKPRLRTIELAAEETLATGCKIAPAQLGKSDPRGCNTLQCALKLGS